MSNFKEVKVDGTIKDMVKSIFDSNLKIDGNWGYSQELATVINSNNTIPTKQLQQMLISMRAYLEMNITQTQEDRYANINPNELSREEVSDNYYKVTYQITAIKEDIYNRFIKEYKKGHNQKDFDLTAHFNRRKEASLKREVIYWFKIV